MLYVIENDNISEFGNLTICALRYCVGRISYMPTLIIDATKDNWKHLTSADKEIIKRDVVEAIQSRNLGMSCDIKAWEDFHQWLLENTIDLEDRPTPELDKLIKRI